MRNSSDAGDAGSADPYPDTVRIRVLPESLLAQGAGSGTPAPSFDPYSTDLGAQAAPAKPRRTLDDMRRLSEAIKRIRACTGYEARRRSPPGSQDPDK